MPLLSTGDETALPRKKNKQNDFINGVLGFKEAVEIKPFIINKIKEYQKNNSEIIFLKDTHDENYLNTIEGKKLPIVHTIKNTHG